MVEIREERKINVRRDNEMRWDGKGVSKKKKDTAKVRMIQLGEWLRR